MTKKIFAMFLAVLMVVSMLPTSVFAAEEACPGADVAHSLRNCADYTAVYVKPANCGEQGYTTYKCNKCSATFVDSWTAPSGEHTMVPAEEKDNVPAYCGVEGAEGGMICSVCKNYREGQKVIPAIGEKGVTQCEMPAWEVAVKDCTEEFTLTRTCLNCTKTEEVKHELEEDEEYDHSWGAWEIVTPATATAAGKAVRKCIHGVAGLWSCGAVEEQEVFFAHEHDDKTLKHVDKVPETCTATGVEAHDMCRICGKLFVDDEEVTAAELVIPAYHDQLKADKTKLNCKKTSMVCDKTDCDVVVRIDINQAHTFGAWTVPAGSAATCVLDGYRTAKCTLCDYVKTENLPALGHIEASYTVAATCSQYEYTFTYCLRDGCTVERLTSTTKKNGNTNVEFDLTVGSALLTAPTANLGFYLQVQQGNLDKTLYFNGKTANKAYYLGTTEKLEEAVKVSLEIATDDGVNQTYKMYFMDGTTKTYISIYKNGTYINAKISAEAPTTTWAWNAEKGILTTKIDNVEYYLGTYDEFKTLSASKLSYLDTSFGSEMLVVNDATGVRMLDITPNFTAGMAPEAHKLETLSETASTCLVNGTRIQICSLCKTPMAAEVLPKADHKWVDDGLDTTVNVDVDCLTDGKEYQKCSVCGVANVKVTPATGHTYKKENNQIVVGEEKGNHKNIITYKFNICEDDECPLLTQKDYNGNSLNDTTNGGARVIIESTIGAWVGTGKVYANEAAAAADHPGFAVTSTNAKPEYDKAATCTVAGYKAYSCADCKNTVMIKSWAGVDAENNPVVHTDYEAAQIAASCTQEGGFYTYTCACGEVIGKECTASCNHVERHWNKTADKLSHEWEATENYVAPDCDKPDYTKEVKTCKNCSEIVYAHTPLESITTPDAMKCENGYFEYYYCYKCDDTHMRSFISGMAHEWVNVGTPTAPTCTTFGHQDKVCKWCGAEGTEAVEQIAKLPHENAAGEKFFATCLDTTADRHCVKCCAASCKNADGSLKHNCADPDNNAQTTAHCACYFPAQNHVFGDWTYVEDTCEELPYKYHVCTVCYYTPAAEFVSQIQKVENGTPVVDKNGKPVMEDVVIGHRPVAVDVVSGAKVYYGQYTYEDYPEYAVYNWVDAVDAQNNPIKVVEKDMMDGYEAKYLAYTAPTFTSEGYAKYVCAVCGETHEEILPATAGLGFELEVKNANGQEGITNGSLVNVTLFANGADVEVNFFSLLAEFEGMIFVGSQPATTDFNITVTNTLKANVGSEVAIIAKAANTADKKQQNITIGEKTPIVVMQFIVMVDGELEVEMAGTAASLNGAAVACKPAEVEFEVKELLNFNEDDSFSIVDLIQAEAIVTGESEKTYDVSIDVDKDGEVTLYDLTLIYEFYVNMVSMTEEEALEFILTGLSEEHVAVVYELFENMEEEGKHECVSKYCTYMVDDTATTCPVCGTIQ